MTDLREQSAACHGIDSWGVDTRIQISDIHVIESLEGGFAGRTGTRLFENLESLCLPAVVKPELHQPRNRASFFGLLDRIELQAKNGRFPLLHFETHGISVPAQRRTSPGIVLASREGVTWQELSPRFTAINEHTRLRLLVFMASCHGADSATLLQPLDPAPVRLIIGPKETVPARVIESATGNFYRSLLHDGDLSAAFAAIGAAAKADDPGFWKLPAEVLFLETMKSYFNEKTTDQQIAARAERIVASLALQGVPAKDIAIQRAKAKALIADRRWLFRGVLSALLLCGQVS